MRNSRITAPNQPHTIPTPRTMLLRDLGQQGRPVIKAGPFGSSIKKEDYVPSGYKVYGQEQVIRGDAFHGEYFITENKFNELRSCSVSPGDVLISLVGTIGKALVVPSNALPGIINPRLLRITLDQTLISSSFLKLFLEADSTVRVLRRWSQGGTMDVLNGEILGALPVHLPALPVQEHFVSVASHWTSAIDATELLIAAKERHFSALLSRLITNHARSTSWQQVPIGHIAERVQRQGDGGDYPLLTIASASGFVPQEEKYGRYMAGESAKTYTLLRRGEFSYNKGNSLRFEFGCIFQLQDYEAALVPSVYVSFKPHESVCAAYLGHLLSADYLKPQLRALVKTGVRNNGLLNIRPDEFMGTTVPLPPFQEQKRIADMLDAARLEIVLLVKQVEALKTQKRGLMQKLLTGQWRVTVPSMETA